MKKILATTTAVLLSLGASVAAAEECGDVSMAEFNWASGELIYPSSWHEYTETTIATTAKS